MHFFFSLPDFILLGFTSKIFNEIDASVFPIFSHREDICFGSGRIELLHVNKFCVSFYFLM